MREIKFRALSMCKGERWVYGDLRHYARNPHTEKWTIHDPATGLETDIDETTIGQYTGLKDKDGKEIYEGDLLRFPPKGQWEEKNYIAFEVFWHDNDCADRHIGWQINRLHFEGSVCGVDIGIITFLPKWVEKMYVIGNVFDKNNH